MLIYFCIVALTSASTVINSYNYVGWQYDFHRRS